MIYMGVAMILLALIYAFGGDANTPEDKSDVK